MSATPQNTRELWHERFARFDSWSPAQKIFYSMLVFAIPCHLAYKLGFDLLVGNNIQFDWVFWLGMAIISIIVAISGYLMWRKSLSRIPFYCSAYLYWSWALVVTVNVGAFDNAYATFPLFFLLVGFLFDRNWYPLQVVGFWGVASFSVLAAQHFGWLSYAPGINGDMAEVRASSGWLLVNILFIGLLFFSTYGVLSLVSNSRDQALASVERSRTIIRRYLPPAVADQIIAGEEQRVEAPQRRRVTMLFADIVGFTDIADRVEPEVMTQVLSEYLSHMADIIAEQGGTLNEFAGDGLMALFGAPNEREPREQASSAVTAALAMQQIMSQLNHNWRELGLGAELKTRIGINTGMVSVGSYGSKDRMTYTAIGLQTNIASRLEATAHAGQILISDASYQLVSGQIECTEQGEVECKGVHYPIKAYSPHSQQKAPKVVSLASQQQPS